MIKRLIAVFFCLLLASPAWAALTVDATTNFQQDANADPWTISHTTASGATSMVVLCVASTANQPFVGATYNSVAMSKVVPTETNVSFVAAVVFELANPDSGTHDVSVDVTASLDGGCVVRTYLGSATATSGGTQHTTGGTGTSMNITCAAGNQAISMVMVANLVTITTDGSQTEIMNENDGGQQYAASSKAGAGTTNMSYTWGSSQGQVHAGVCVEAAAVATVVPTAPIFFQ